MLFQAFSIFSNLCCSAKETQTKETVSSARDNEDKSQTVVEDKKEDDKPQSEHINFDLDKEEEKVVEKDNEIKSNATQTQPKAPMFDVIRRDYKTLFGGEKLACFAQNPNAIKQSFAEHLLFFT